MAFMLNGVVPWGRNLDEYKKMFLLEEEDLQKRIAGFGDGPASFNYEAYCLGHNVISYDPIYQFSRDQLKKRIDEVRETVMRQMKENMDNYVWTKIKNLNQLEEVRMSAMKLFLADFESGKAEGRYVYHELPNRLPVADDSYDLGLSSHFLLMYTSLGYDFHIKAISEMLRVCKEIRIFPIVDLDAKQTDLIRSVIDYFQKLHFVELRETDYVFQKGANRMLVIRQNKA